MQVLRNETYSPGDSATSVHKAFSIMDEMMKGQRGWRGLAELGDKGQKFAGTLEGILWSPKGGYIDKLGDSWGTEEVKQWIKPSLVSGSGVVKKYLDKSGLQNHLGFHIVCYGCTTYIGNSRELDESVSAAIYENDIVTAAVLSGNRNFASPPLDVAYYLAGSVNIGCKKEPIGILQDGKKVYFWDIWPSTEEFAELAVLEHLDECTSDGHGGKAVPKFCSKHVHMQVLRNETYSPGDSGTSVHKDFKQFFVRVHGSHVSTQEDLNTMTVKMLIESACQKKGIKADDLYATYLGKRLDEDKLLSYYPIYKDITINVRSRLRAGRAQIIDCNTFSDIINQRDLFHRVYFSEMLTNQEKQEPSVSYLSAFAQYFARQVLISLCRKHYSGKSFNGVFNINHILIYDGRVIFDNDLDEVDFNAITCEHDYWIIEDIFRHLFWDSDNYCFPLFVEHLLTYLWNCPAKHHSNSEAAIAYLTNHPALTSYIERMSQCTILDSMIERLNSDDLEEFSKAIGHPKKNWASDLLNVPAMSNTYFYNSTYYPDVDTTEVAYNTNLVGCLHFSRNFFKHAGNQLDLEEIEAAFSLNVKDFVANLLQNIGLKYKGPPNFDIVKLLGNNLADNDKRNSEGVSSLGTTS